MWNYCYTKFDPQIICKTQFVSFSPESVHQVTKASWRRLTFPAILDIYIALYLTATWHTPEAPLLALECSLPHDRTLKYQTDTQVHLYLITTWVAQGLRNLKNRSLGKVRNVQALIKQQRNDHSVPAETGASFCWFTLNDHVSTH